VLSHISEASTRQGVISVEAHRIASEPVFVNLYDAWKTQREDILIARRIKDRSYDFHHDWRPE
jgi:hypothetical protein